MGPVFSMYHHKE